MALRKLARQIPGLRSTYRAIMLARNSVRRAIVGPTRGERYDLETGEVLARALSRDSICIDVGANVGEILQLMIRCAPEAQHHAIEALPHLAKRLADRFPSVVVHSCAVGNETGETTFNYVTDNPAYSGLRQRSYPRNDYEIRKITVPVRRVDDLVPSGVVVRLIKADIEGGEYHAFLGARQIIQTSKPFIIFEFGKGGAGWYGISPAMMYALLNGEFGLHVSTMRRWLDNQPPLSDEEFRDSFDKDIDVYFMAYPGAATGR